MLPEHRPQIKNTFHLGGRIFKTLGLENAAELQSKVDKFVSELCDSEIAEAAEAAEAAASDDPDDESTDDATRKAAEAMLAQQKQN